MSHKSVPRHCGKARRCSEKGESLRSPTFPHRLLARVCVFRVFSAAILLKAACSTSASTTLGNFHSFGAHLDFVRGLLREVPQHLLSSNDGCSYRENVPVIAFFFAVALRPVIIISFVFMWCSVIIDITYSYIIFVSMA